MTYIVTKNHQVEMILCVTQVDALQYFVNYLELIKTDSIIQLFNL